MDQPTRTPARSIPAFHVTPGKARKDGWAPLKQAEFIGELAETRNVAEAARRVGMTREGAYRLRRRKWSASFCAAWDAAMGRAPMAFAPAFPGAGLVKARLARLGAQVPAMDFEGARERAGRGTPDDPKVTLAELQWRCETGLWSVILHRGKYAGVRQKADNSALLAVIRRSGLDSRRGVQAGGDGERSRV